ncbi:MAG TPA: cyclic nucleotide-binding domain-containing protein [Gaiellaceae bacterium]|jgi:CRP-like cAMP-binding protein|nr:cyclic nucleotide-binding domain-containing protein [Gaiellaceae bacterium]
MADVEVEAVAEAIARVPLFRGLSQDHREDIARHSTRRAYPAGATIVKQGDTSMSFYMVLAGKVRFVREGDGNVQVDAIEGGPGTFFGELGLIDDTERERTVIADEPTECALLVKADFQRELREDPEIALALLPILNSRIRRLEEELARALTSAG